MSGPAPRLLNTLLLTLLPIAEAGATQFFITVDPATGEQSLFVGAGVGEGSRPAPPEVEGAAYALGALQLVNVTGSSASDTVIDNLADILTQPDPAVMAALLRNKAALDQENQALLEQLRNPLPSPKGTGPGAPKQPGIDDAIKRGLQQAAANGHIDADTINAIIDQAQGHSSDSADTSRPSLPQDSTEREIQLEKQRRLAEQRRQQQEQKEQRRQEATERNKQLIESIQQAQKEQQRKNEQARQEKAAEAQQKLQDTLTQEQRDQLAARQRRQQEQSGAPGADRPDRGALPTAPGPIDLPGDTGSVAGGGALADGGGEAANGPLDSNLAAVLQALNNIGDFNPEDFNTMESFARHISASYGLDLSTFIDGDGQDGELDTNRLIAALTQPGLEDVNTDFTNESTRQEAITETAEDAAQEIAGAHGWADFTFYNNEQYFPGILETTRALDGSETATYTGLVRSGSNSSIAATGTITMDFTFTTGAMTGQIAFDNNMGGLMLEGSAQETHFGIGANGEAFGGIAEGHLEGAFFGPNAEEVGGHWNVSVEGSPLGNTAGGDFAAKQ